MKENIVSLLQHDCYGSVLHDYTCITLIDLLAFSVGVGGEGVRESLELKVLKMNVKNYFYIQLENKTYRQ